MKRKVLKIYIILIIIQLIFSMININIVNASTSDDIMTHLESQEKKFEQMGNNKLGTMGIEIGDFTSTLGLILGLFHLLAIAFTSGRFLLSLVRILKQDTINKSKAKKEMTTNIILVFLAVTGVGWVKKLILAIA